MKIAVENHAGDMQAWELVEPDRGGGKELRRRDHGPGQRHLDPGRPAGQPGDPRPVRGHHRHPRHGRVGDGQRRHLHVGQHGTGRRRLAAYVKRFESFVPTFRSSWRSSPTSGRTSRNTSSPNSGRDSPRPARTNSPGSSRLAKRGKKFEIPPGRPSGRARRRNWNRRNRSSTWKKASSTASKFWDLGSSSDSCALAVRQDPADGLSQAGSNCWTAVGRCGANHK